MTFTIAYFKKNVTPKLVHCKLTYHSYPKGDFGFLERVEVENPDKNRLGTIDIWSMDFLGMDIYDIKAGEQIFNLLLDDQDSGEKKLEAIQQFVDFFI